MPSNRRRAALVVATVALPAVVAVLPAAVAVLLAVVAVLPAVVAAAPPLPEPPTPFGRVIYRAARVASFESLGVTMIACRHRDPTPRRFAVQFFDRNGQPVSTFATVPASPRVPAGEKVVFVTDGLPFEGADVVNLRVGHLALGTARVVSDAAVARCIGKMRMDAGAGSPSYRDEIGLVRAGRPLPALSNVWRTSPWAPRRRY